MPAPTPSASPDDDQTTRSKRLLLVIAAVVALSAVVAGFVIFSGGETKSPKEPVAAVATSGQSLVLGRPSAATKVVVYEDFGSTASRDFEIASRDFLLIEAAQGHVRVEYHPVQLAAGYSQQALEAWAAVVEHGTPAQVMAFHNRLFDRQPEATTTLTTDDLERFAVAAGVRKGVVSDGLASPDTAFVASARAAARTAGVATVPQVLVDGKPLSPGTGVDLADRLQRQVLEESR
ncbi:MAG: pknE [Marmoricola sp.]|jgi:protein-disulfide isomerase|nr:pknE [Marmoricola sp.]